MLLTTYAPQLSPSYAVAPICLPRLSMVEPYRASLLGAILQEDGGEGPSSEEPNTTDCFAIRARAQTPPSSAKMGKRSLLTGLSWSSCDEEARSSPRDMSRALTAFHPSLPSPVLSPPSLRARSSSRRSSPGAFGATHVPSLRAIPSGAPPVDVVPARAQRVGAFLKMRKSV